MVRCIYGSRPQELAEKAGMKEWCDKHCEALGYKRAFICHEMLLKNGVNPEEHKK